VGAVGIPGRSNTSRRGVNASASPTSRKHDEVGIALALYSSPMVVFCAWCRHEQKVGYLGMREPLENPVVTHGVCREHQQRLLESFPSRSFPDVELLIIVRRNGTTLYESLERAYADTPRVKVLVDRRVGERRSASHEVVIERRGRSTRRIRRGTVSVVGGFMTVRFTPKRIAPPPPEIYSL
jgi:hypothetical protein